MMNTIPTLLTRPIRGMKLGDAAQASGVLRGSQHSSVYERLAVKGLSADCFELLRTLSSDVVVAAVNRAIRHPMHSFS